MSVSLSVCLSIFFYEKSLAGQFPSNVFLICEFPPLCLHYLCFIYVSAFVSLCVCFVLGCFPLNPSVFLFLPLSSCDLL